MKILQILVVILAFNFIIVFGQNKNADKVVVTGTIKVENYSNDYYETVIDSKSITELPKSSDINELPKTPKTQKKVKNKKIEKKKEQKKHFEIVKSAVVIFRNEKFEEFRTYTNSKGKYKIILPKGKYQIYSTMNDKCWMCAEYIPQEVFQLTENKFKLDIVLRSGPTIE